MSAEPIATKSMEDLVSLCKRRGFIYPASEIYGGINGFWDYGPLGIQLKNNLRDWWWESMVLLPPDGPDGEPLSIVGLDSSIIQNPKVWEASGHVGGFNDPMVQCTAEGCRKLFRADHVWEIVFVRTKDIPAWVAHHEHSANSPESYSALVKKTFGESFGSIGALSSEEIGTLNDLIDDHDLDYPMPQSVVKTVQAGSAEEALEIVELKSKERSQGFRPVPDKVGLATPLLYPHSGTQNFRRCPACHEESLDEPRAFNLMFPTIVGATGDWEDNKAYLRPETAQGIFINYKNVLDTTRVRVPFGIAQVGKAFRNEVTPRNFIFRSREFEQMEMEWFCHPDEAAKWYDFWQRTRLAWWRAVGLTGDDLVMRAHDSDELSHYAKDGCGTADVEYRYPFTAPGFGELEGIAHRSSFDLAAHEEHARAKLSYFDQERNERYLPHVIEPAAGLSRGVLAVLCEAYTPDAERPSKVYMKFHPRLAPIKAAVFALVKKDGMPEAADRLARELRGRFGRYGLIECDAKQSIGKRYARMDEAGTPFCFTVDGQTLQDQTVTMRDRDSASQERMAMDRVGDFLGERLGLG